MNKIIKLIFVLCCFCGIAQAQPQRPKLVVGIVIDQMRWDYLYRYYARYGEGGLRYAVGLAYALQGQCGAAYGCRPETVGRQAHIFLVSLKSRDNA